VDARLVAAIAAAAQILTAVDCSMARGEAGDLQIHVGACEGQLQRLAVDLAGMGD